MILYPFNENFKILSAVLLAKYKDVELQCLVSLRDLVCSPLYQLYIIYTDRMFDFSIFLEKLFYSQTQEKLPIQLKLKETYTSFIHISYNTYYFDIWLNLVQYEYDKLQEFLSSTELNNLELYSQIMELTIKNIKIISNYIKELYYNYFNIPVLILEDYTIVDQELICPSLFRVDLYKSIGFPYNEEVLIVCKQNGFKSIKDFPYPYKIIGVEDIYEYKRLCKLCKCPCFRQDNDKTIKSCQLFNR